MPIALSKTANKESTFGVIVTFADEDGAPLIPTTASWSLYAQNGAVVNSRENVALVPAASIAIVLSGADLAILDEANPREKRRIKVSAVYSSSLGTNLPLKEAGEFWVINTDPDEAA
jgi:hypothetical protein